MEKPSEHNKSTSDNNIIQFKKPVHDHLKCCCVQWGSKRLRTVRIWPKEGAIAH